MTTSKPDLHKFLVRTLCYVQHVELGVDIVEVAQDALQQLIALGYVTTHNDGQQLDITRLGRAVFKGTNRIDIYIIKISFLIVYVKDRKWTCKSMD